MLVRETAFLFQRNVYPNLMEMFCVMALADGVVTDAEQALLKDAERAFGLPGYADSYFSSRGIGGNAGSTGRQTPPSPQNSLDDAYKTLGIEASAGDDEVKKAWRKKALEFHPDKIQGKGLPDAFVQFANAETRRINDAYDRISKARGMK